MAVTTAPKNIVSQPPLTTRMTDSNGNPSRAWAIWFRDLYVRTSYKGGNAIDAEGANLTEVIEAVNQNILDIEQNGTDIADNSEAIESNKDDIEASDLALANHADSSIAHGSNGAIIGSEDFATPSIAGLVKSMQEIADLAVSTTSITIPDVGSAPSSYSQSYANEQTAMANEAKLKINQLVNDLTATANKINAILLESKQSGQMDDL